MVCGSVDDPTATVVIDGVTVVAKGQYPDNATENDLIQSNNGALSWTWWEVPILRGRHRDIRRRGL